MSVFTNTQEAPSTLSFSGNKRIARFKTLVGYFFGKSRTPPKLLKEVGRVRTILNAVRRA